MVEGEDPRPDGEDRGDHASEGDVVPRMKDAVSGLCERLVEVFDLLAVTVREQGRRLAVVDGRATDLLEGIFEDERALDDHFTHGRRPLLTQVGKVERKAHVDGGRIDELVSFANDLHGRTGALEEAVDKQEDVLASLRAQVNRLRTEYADGGDLHRHYELASGYEYLVNQVLPKLARLRRGGPDPEDQAGRARRNALTVRRLWQAAIGWSDVDRDTIDDILGLAPPSEAAAEGEHTRAVRVDQVDDLCSELQAFRNRLWNARPAVVFPADVEPGAAFDGTHMQLWKACSPEHPVLFVVAPGYGVSGRVMCLPWVFTEATEATGGSAGTGRADDVDLAEAVLPADAVQVGRPET